MKINGFKKINLNNPDTIEISKVNDKIIYDKNGIEIKALILDKKNISFNSVYRTKNQRGEKMINLDCFFKDEGKIKNLLYEEFYENDEGSGNYKYLNKKLLEANM